MTGVAVKGKDRAGGKQAEQANDWFRLDDDPVVTVGDTVEPHGTHTPAPTMVEGEEWFLVDDTPVCRAENKANCGHATTGRQWFLLERADNGYRPYLTSAGDPCNIEHIPWIMRANGWYEGAKLMDQWFSRKASTEKKPEDSDTTTIKMDWVLELDEARTAYDELMNEALWTVPNGKNDTTPLHRLCNGLRDKGFLTDHPMEFTFDMPVWTLKGRQFDDRIIRKGEFGEEPLFIFDKHGAALGQFELLLAAAGEAEPLPDGVTHRITLREKGVFVEDQYDFEGHQFLGFWDIESHRASLLPIIPPSCLSWVDNGSFRSWRDRTNMGGDYFVYSDVKQEAIDPPIVFYCPSGALQT